MISDMTDDELINEFDTPASDKEHTLDEPHSDNHVESNLSSLTQNLTKMVEDITKKIPTETPPTSNDTESENLENPKLKKLVDLSNEIDRTDKTQIKKQGNPVINKQLKFIVDAIDNIYPVRFGKVFKSSTKRELYTYYKLIKGNIVKYINDLSSDVTSNFYQLLKDDKKNDFSKLGKNGFDMKTFYIDPTSKTATAKTKKPPKKPTKKSISFGGGFGNIFSSKSPVDTKIQQKLLTKLFVATSKDGKKLDDIQKEKIKQSQKEKEEGKTEEGKTEEGEETISSKFEEILNVVIPDIAAIIYYGYKLDYNNSILHKTGKTTTAASSAVKSGVSAIGHSVYHAPGKLWTHIRGNSNRDSESGIVSVGGQVGGENKNGNGKTRFKTPEWLCKPDDVPDICNKSFINFLIGILLNPNYNPNINSDKVSFDKIFKVTSILTSIEDPTIMRLHIDNLMPDKIKILKFSNIFLYNIWLLIIFKFILNQGYLDDDLILKTRVTELGIKDNKGNIYNISNPTLGMYIKKFIGYIKELDKKYPMLETEEKEEEEDEDEDEDEEDEEEENGGKENGGKENGGEEEGDRDDEEKGDDEEEGDENRGSLDSLRSRMSDVDGGGRKYTTKKRKPLLTLKKRYKKSRNQTKKNKKSRYLTKKLKKKFRK
jgi:hypothetical protein